MKAISTAGGGLWGATPFPDISAVQLYNPHQNNIYIYIYLFGAQTLNFTKNKKIKNNKIMLININHDNR